MVYCGGNIKRDLGITRSKKRLNALAWEVQKGYMSDNQKAGIVLLLKTPDKFVTSIRAEDDMVTGERVSQPSWVGRFV